MAVNFISTYNLLNGPRKAARDLQTEIGRLNKEIIEGRHADVGLVLGEKTGYAALMYQEISYLASLTASNGLTTGRLDITQATLTDMREAADKFMSTLVGLPSNSQGAETLRNDAKRNLQSLVANLNSAFGGERLFSGIKTDTIAVKAGGEAAVEAGFDTFFAAFTTYWQALGNTDPPTYQDIGEQEFRLFLYPTDPDNVPDNPAAFKALATALWPGVNHDAQFNDTNWAANWSSASDTNLHTQISKTETIDTSVNANAAPFRTLAKAYTMLASLPSDALNENAFKEAVSYAMAQFGEALNGLTIMQADLGSAQTRIKTTNEGFKVREALLKQNLATIEGVDPYEAKVMSDALELQLNLSYSLTARLQRLSLLNFI